MIEIKLLMDEDEVGGQSLFLVIPSFAYACSTSKPAQSAQFGMIRIRKMRWSEINISFLQCTQIINFSYFLEPSTFAR